MIIAMEYDQTYVSDPALWGSFITSAKKSGHTVAIVTSRHEPNKGISFNDDVRGVGEKYGIDVVFAHGAQKASIFKADIWIDDSPSSVPSAEDLSCRLSAVILPPVVGSPRGAANE